MSEPLITAIVSTFRAERFMRGCLEDLVAQTLIDRLEILVIDSGSPEGEGAICNEFAKRYPQIRYVRTEREPLYAAWNRAIGLARGIYLTNANTDARHSPDFMATMVDVLERRPEISLVYAHQLISHTENETFAECKSRGAGLRRYLDNTMENLMVECITGSQPVWRKALHEQFGLFDTKYQICADRDMWMRFAATRPLLQIPGPLGVVYIADNTLSGSRYVRQMEMENLDIDRKFIELRPWSELPAIRKRMAELTFGRGYRYIRHERNTRAALPFFREAIRLDPTNFRFIKTLVLRYFLSRFSVVKS